MRIYIDVTKLLEVSYVTGIQRVVREVVLRLLQKEGDSIVLMNYNEGYRLYKKVNNEKFIKYFKDSIGKKEELVTNVIIRIDDMQPGDIFFDIDSVWNLPLRRSVLLPKLKANGVKLVAYIYDIIPITHSQFCHSETVYNFMNYIGAYLQHADLVIASAQSTLDALDELVKQLDLPKIPGAVSWLGSDFNVQESNLEEVAEEAKSAVNAGKYVLMIGTIEPRKNHALVLDAFDNLLFKNGVNLIFAGKVGWNIDTFKARMDVHPKRNQQFFFLEGMNDATIDYLYKHAYCVAFPTFNEGFGLPIIESFQRGVPVLASDIPILREVGGEYCEYFDPFSWKSFSTALLKWLNSPQEYEAIKDKIATYIPITWDKVADNIWKMLMSVVNEFPYTMQKDVKQIVYLSARENDILNSLPFVEAYMPFIQEMVLCCPDQMVETFKNHYKGRLQVTYLTDSQLLNGVELPKDHAMRNFYLRCQAMKQEELADVFIMADDDYRPLKTIDSKVFLENGIYQGYYFYHLRDWKGDQSHPSSFDRSMYRTVDFLEKNHYSTWMYDSHMPQIIDKRVFLEMLDKHPDIENKGLSDWSMYFNYLSTRYSSQINNCPYVTLGWPGSLTAWDVEIQPQDFLFENYYEELYEEGELFEGFSKKFHDNVECENMSKVVRFLNALETYNQAKLMFQAYQSNYEWVNGEYPYFGIEIKQDGCQIILPEYVAICEAGFTRVPFEVEYLDRDTTLLQVKYKILDIEGKVLLEGPNMKVDTVDPVVEVVIRGIDSGMKAILEVETTLNDIVNVARTKLCIMKKGI